MAQFFDNDILCHNRIAYSNAIEECAEKAYENLTLGTAVKITNDFELYFCTKQMENDVSFNPRINPNFRHYVKKGSVALLVDFKPYIGKKIGLASNSGQMFEYVDLEKIPCDDKPHSFFILPVWLIDNKIFSVDIHPAVYEIFKTSGNDGNSKDKHWRTAVIEAKEKIYKYFVKSGRINNDEEYKNKFLSGYNSVSLSKKDTNIVKHSTSNIYMLDNDKVEPFVSIILPSKNLSSNNFIISMANKKENNENPVPMKFSATRERGQR